MLHTKVQTTQSMMKAIALDRFGGLETLKLQMTPVPEVGPNEVLIHVEWAGVGQWDPFEREGGFYAEYAAVKADNVSRIPGNLASQQAGAMPADGMTALRGLDDTLALKPAELLMIFGASGGIGHLAVQLAKRMGAGVFAVASGSDGVALVKKLGADAVIDGRKDDIVTAARQFAPNGLHAALITAGGPAADKALAAMRAGGRVAYPNGVEPTPKPPVGIDAKSYDGMPNREAIEKLNRLIESSPPGIGPFEVHVARSFPLDQAAEAHRALEEHYLGKLVLQTA